MLPDELAPLSELALNLRWSWHADTRRLFSTIDPELWRRTGGDPVRLLAAVPPERLTRLAADRRFLTNLALIQEDLDEYLTGDRWYQRYAAEVPAAPAAIGYFSPEFGITEVLPQYSGGLGILAGDHLKTASDLGAPIIGVGLLYRQGYFRQALDGTGWQQEQYPLLDPNALPLTLLHGDLGDGTGDGPVRIEVPLGDHRLVAQVWLARVGRVPLLLLDSELEANTGPERQITDRLYGGGADHRLAQEVLLGIGGVRAIRAYCAITGRPAPDVFHTNEGHAGFLGLERIREYLADGLGFDAALERTRAGTVFTTHTPVPAGIDRFPRQLIKDQFADFGDLEPERILELGTEDFDGGDPDTFNMAVMGLRLAQRANGVSRLHGRVSRQMFRGLWPDFDEAEVPIGSITNGVHHASWMHPELLELLEATTDSGADGGDPDGYRWAGLAEIDAGALWSLKRRMRGQLITSCRERLAASAAHRGQPAEWTASVLDEDVITFGFARRVPSYKRLTLMLRDPERLTRLLTHPTRPIQLVVAGKAHPADEGGKRLIQQLVRFADEEQVRRRIVFLPDYDIAMAKPLYPGCDVWLNNPLRPYEACGTSGMKAALNGASNLSIRDGWWDEWYDPAYGWEIPSAEGAVDQDHRDDLEAAALYDVIENEIVPRFYDADADGIPHRWVRLIRDAIAGLGPKVLAARMVRDYVTDLYTPAAASSHALDDQSAEALAAWKRRLRSGWRGVIVDHVASRSGDAVQVGDKIEVSALVRLGDLDPEDVRVELVTGELDGDDELRHTHVVSLDTGVDADSGLRRYSGVIEVGRAGGLGYTVRVVPHHDQLASSAELSLVRYPGDLVS
ncbi:alpha-glucan family phosphorylase [Microlunatus speluncae]|uniref:alpha-glucan family phosphorylase n=1 Tax=Microlunatus speluncae TaxID=2594267 RepID=UPI001FE50A4A|nr:alpha-glucan family phosphorylase [Microlunatus speluncae]